MRKFKHLDYYKRRQLENMLKHNYPVSEIACCLDVALSTVYLEIKRGKCEQMKSDLTKVYRYSADYAQHKYLEALKRKGKTSKILKDDKLNKYIGRLIGKKKYSPEAVIYKLKNSEEEFLYEIKSYTTIYTAIKKGYIRGVKLKDLPRGKYRKLKHKDKKYKKELPGKSIEERPEIVNARTEFGHWEMDSVIGMQTNRNTLLVLTERKTRQEIIEKMKAHTMQEVVKALNRIEKRFKGAFYDVFKSITVDNGSEFQDCAGMEKALYRVGKRTEIYYCHPYSPGERGSNENCNLLIRRFLHKGMDFDKYLTTKKAKEIEQWINRYPRRIHRGKSSEELFKQELENLGLDYYYLC
ncbi:MAG: IS30 family transposase [Eubacterium sp.]|nr:IS30 family transposase [Eubacterium sp.]